MRFAAALLLGLGIISNVIMAAEATIIAREVEVRSGPSQVFYPTGKLYQRDRVTLRPEKNKGGFLAIEPPNGSFSLIPKEKVTTQGSDGRTGVVVVGGADTFVGSSIVDKHNVQGARLSGGYQVTLLDSTLIRGHYKIEPAEEVRYIPAEAIERKQEIQLTAGAPIRPTETGYAGDEATLLQKADEAYRQGEKTGDWSNARRMYEQIAHGKNHEARMIAWNRLEFIRGRSQGGYYPQAPASRAAPAYQVPRPYSSAYSPARYYYPQRNYSYPQTAWAPGGPTAPAAPAARANSHHTYTTDAALNRFSSPPAPTSRSRYIAPAVNATAVPNNVGRLTRSYMRVNDGRPLYRLEDSRGQLKCYVEPSGGLNLDSYVNSVVEIQGGPMMYNPDWRQNVLVATQVTLR